MGTALAFVEVAAEEVAAFETELGALLHWGDPRDGVFVEVDDVAEQWAHLRALVAVRAPRVHAVAPHVTVVHSRTSGLGELA